MDRKSKLLSFLSVVFCQDGLFVVNVTNAEMSGTKQAEVETAALTKTFTRHCQQQKMSTACQTFPAELKMGKCGLKG